MEVGAPGGNEGRGLLRALHAFSGIIERQMGESRVRTAARCVLLEEMHDGDVQAPLLTGRERLQRWMEAGMTPLGAADPRATAQTVITSSIGEVHELRHLA